MITAQLRGHTEKNRRPTEFHSLKDVFWDGGEISRRPNFRCRFSKNGSFRIAACIRLKGPGINQIGTAKSSLSKFLSKGVQVDLELGQLLSSNSVEDLLVVSLLLEFAFAGDNADVCGWLDLVGQQE